MTDRVSSLVLSCTSDVLREDDWQSIMSLVDLVNGQPQLAQPALECLQPRLAHKSHAIGLRSITVLEALMKNCSFFHPLVASGPFMQELVKIIPKQIREGNAKSFFRKDATRDVLGMERWDRLLLLLQSWAHSFKIDSPYPIFVEIYREMQRRGVKFPEPAKDELAPVFTPPPNPRARSSIVRPVDDVKASSSASGPIKFHDSDCAMTYSSSQVLLDMINATDNSYDLKHNELIIELVHAMQNAHRNIQSRLVAADGHVNMGELLALNDVIVDILNYYDGLSKGTVKRRAKQTQPQPQAQQEDEDDDEDDDDEEEEEDEAEPVKRASPDKSASASASVPSSSVRVSPSLPKLAPPAPAATRAATRKKKNSAVAATPPQPIAAATNNAGPNLFDLFSMVPAASAPAPVPAPVPSFAPASGASPFDFPSPAPAHAADDDDPFMALATRTSTHNHNQATAPAPAPSHAHTHTAAAAASSQSHSSSLPTLDDFDRLALR